VNPVGRDSVEPKLDLMGKSHGSTESRPTVHGGEVERAEPDTELHCSPVLRPDVVSTGDAEGAGAVRPVRAAHPALPCHNSNGCIE